MKGSAQWCVISALGVQFTLLDVASDPSLVIGRTSTPCWAYHKGASQL